MEDKSKCCFRKEIPHEPKDSVQERLMAISRPCSLKPRATTAAGKYVGFAQPSEICLACCMRISILMREIEAYLRDGSVTMETLRDRQENVLDFLSPSSKVIAQGLMGAGFNLATARQECEACNKHDYTVSYEEGLSKGYKFKREIDEKIMETARELKTRRG